MGIVIRRTSWHYRLHSFVRRMWGLEPSPKDRWSLCPYFQTTFWGSILTALVIPFAIIGWMFCKVLRKMYKSGARGGLFSYFSAFCDGSKLGINLDKAPQDFQKMPLPASLYWFMKLIFALIITTGLCLIVFLLCLGGWRYIPQLPHILWIGCLFVGWTLFHVSGAVGWAGQWIAYGAKLAFKFICHQIASIFLAFYNWLVGDFWHWLISGQTWATLFHYTWQIVAGLAFLAIIGFAIYVFFNSRFYQWLCVYVEMRANGYAEAREKRLNAASAAETEASRKALADRIAAYKNEQDSGYSVSKSSNRFLTSIGRMFVACFEGMAWFVEGLSIIWEAICGMVIGLYSRRVYVNGEPKDVLGPIGILWHGIVAAKRGVCPIVEFADDADLKNPSPPTAPVTGGTPAS